MAEEKKRPVAHEAAIKLLEEAPLAHLDTLAQMYLMETVVPPKDIPKLIKAFDDIIVVNIRDRRKIEKVIKVLREQLREAKKKAKQRK